MVLSLHAMEACPSASFLASESMRNEDGSLLPMVRSILRLQIWPRSQVGTYWLTHLQWRSCRVGGIIGETSFKYFIQFLIYAALYCLFILIIMVVFVAEGIHQVRINWYLLL